VACGISTSPKYKYGELITFVFSNLGNEVLELGEWYVQRKGDEWETVFKHEKYAIDIYLRPGESRAEIWIPGPDVRPGVYRVLWTPTSAAGAKLQCYTDFVIEP